MWKICYLCVQLYKQYNIPTPASIVIDNLESLKEVDISNLNYPLVVKAQVQVGGRGKAGGIKVVNNYEEMSNASNEILGMSIKDHIVEKLLIEEASVIEDEYYISFTLDRAKKQYLKPTDRNRIKMQKAIYSAARLREME